MKKLRIVALLVTLLLTVTVFAGCDKVKVDDVKADPMKYISEGMALTLDGTPFANITDAAKNGSYQLVWEGAESSADVKLYLDAEAAKGAVELEMEVPSEYDYDDETGEFITTATEKIALDAYYADKKLAIKSDLLNDFVGTDTIGLDMNITAEDIRASALYNAILGLSDITEAEDTLNIEAIANAFTEYINACTEIGKNTIEFGEVAEETIQIDDKEIKTIAVPYTIKEDLYDSIADEALEMSKAVAKATGEELSEEYITEIKESLNSSIPEIKYDGKVYISAKTGAVIKTFEELEIKIAADEEEATEFKTKNEMIYGADPTVAFLPSVNLEIEVDGEKIAISGKSSVVDDKFVMDGEAKYDAEADEDDDNGTFKFELAADGKFTLTLKDDEDDITIPGTFTSDETKTELTVDLSKAYDEDEVVDITDIKLVITAGEEVPAVPEFKDILDMTEEDLAPIVSMIGMGMGSTDMYEMTVEDYYYELTYYYDQTQLDATLENYAAQGYATEDDMICDLYIGVAKTELLTYMDEATINDSIVTMVNEGYTYKEIADAFYQTLVNYWMSSTDIEY